MAGATTRASDSARCSASRLGTSSPKTSERYEMSTVIPTRATVFAAPSDSPQPSRTGARSSASVAAPKAADRKPAKVTPICSAAR